MTKTIHKYPMVLADTCQTLMPKGAEVLTVQLQRGQLQAWAIIDDELPANEPYMFVIYGTGHPMNDEVETKYINTIQLQEGSLVFHIFLIKGNK